MKQIKLNGLRQVSSYFLYKYTCRINNLDSIFNILSTTHTRAFLLITTEQVSYSYQNMAIITGKHKYYDF